MSYLCKLTEHIMCRTEIYHFLLGFGKQLIYEKSCFMAEILKNFHNVKCDKGLFENHSI